MLGQPQLPVKKRNSKSVLVIDRCSAEGHHSIYMSMSVAALASAGYQVYVSWLDGNALRASLREELLNRITFLPECRGLHWHLTLTVVNALNRIALGKRAREDWPNDFTTLLLCRSFGKFIGSPSTPVFFPYLDAILPTVSPHISKWLFPARWCGIFMHPSRLSRGNLPANKIETLARREANFGLSTCKSVLVFARMCVTELGNKYPRVCFNKLPELIVTETGCSSLSESIRKTAGSRTVFGFVGGLGKNKNFKLFLDSAKLLPPDRFMIAAVGHLPPGQYSSSEIEDMDLKRRGLSENNVLRLDYRIQTEDEFNAILGSFDIVFLVYDSHPFSSNILAKAIALRKAVLVPSFGAMCELVIENKWQAACEPTTASVCGTVQRIAREFRIDDKAHAEYVGTNGIKTFSSAIIECVEAASCQRRANSHPSHS